MSSKKDKNSDIVGFEEFLEFTQSKKPVAGNRSYLKKFDDQFDLLTFLETESHRLEKLVELFQEKVSILKNCPQDISLTVKQETSNITMKTEIVQNLIKKNSPLNQNLLNLFNQFYGNNQTK